MCDLRRLQRLMRGQSSCKSVLYCKRKCLPQTFSKDAKALQPSSYFTLNTGFMVKKTRKLMGKKKGGGDLSLLELSVPTHSSKSKVAVPLLQPQ